MIPKKYYWLIHVAGCIVFLSFPFVTSHQKHGTGYWDLDPMISRDMVQFSLLICFFYLNYYLLIPKLFFTKKYFVYALLLLLCMWLIAYIPQLVDVIKPDHIHSHKEPHHFRPMPGNFFFFRINHNFFLFLAVAFFSLLLKISNRWRQTEKEKISAELSYLKAQINPHFLFNTLNSIYSLAIQKADATAPAVQQLSSMMRYVLNESVNDHVPLQKEIDYISNYVGLQQLRFGKEMHLQFNVTGDIGNNQIAPLILIPFIENAFKYGVNAEEESDIRIMISIENSKLNLEVTNNIIRTKISDEQQGGIGITNTRERLNLIYPSGHELLIFEEGRKHIVKLTIQMHD
jgi:hypothetical protein